MSNLTSPSSYTSNLTSIHGGNITLINNPELCTLQACDLTLGQLEYLPSIWGNAIFVGIFGLLIPIQLFLGIKYKTWGFMVGLILGTVLETVGYAVRILLHFSIFNKAYFVMYLILTIAPAFISAGIYICLSRIVMLYAPHLSRFGPRTYTICFCCSDLISLILQAAGGAFASVATTQDDVDTGTDIMIAGLIVQVVSLVTFVLLCGDFALRLDKNRNAWNTQNASIYLSWKFKAFLYEPPMITIAVIALTVFHPGIGFQRAWGTAKRGYKEGGADLESSSSGEVDAVSDGADVLGRENEEMDDETRTLGDATLRGEEGREMQNFSKGG